LLGALSPRLAFLMLYTMFCLAGMASVQFATRHYFHLEVIPLFIGGALLHLAWRAACLARRADRAALLECVRSRAWLRQRMKNGLAFALAGVALVLLPLWTLRWHQDRQMASLFTAYESAERDTVWPAVAAVEGTGNARVRLACDPVTLPEGLPEADEKGFFQVDMLVLELARANRDVPLAFRYAGDSSERDLSWHTAVAAGADAVRYYVPIYNAVWPDTPDTAAWGDLPPNWTRFEGIEMNTADLPQLKSMRRFRYAAGYTPLVMAVIEDGWESRGLWQRFTR